MNNSTPPKKPCFWLTVMVLLAIEIPQVAAAWVTLMDKMPADWRSHLELVERQD